MKEIKINYFLDGVETKKEGIDWDRTMTITLKGDEPNNAYVAYRDNKGLSTRAKAADICPNGIIGFTKDGLEELKNKLDKIENWEKQNILDNERDATFNNDVWVTDEEQSNRNIMKGFVEVTKYIEDLWEKEQRTLQKNYDWNSVEVKTNESYEPKVKYYNGIATWDTGKVSEGQKFNSNKPQLSLLFTQFPQALEAIVKCSEYGHNKYKETDLDYLNFKKVNGGSKTYADAGLRHRLETGLDSESKLPHQYHVAWNALAELQLWIEENEK